MKPRRPTIFNTAASRAGEYMQPSDPPDGGDAMHRYPKGRGVIPMPRVKEVPVNVKTAGLASTLPPVELHRRYEAPHYPPHPQAKFYSHFTQPEETKEQLAVQHPPVTRTKTKGRITS